ncbi:MAG: homoserine kinase [Magnetovibrionaceae bacterium]
MAVYTDVTDEDLELFAQRYDLGEVLSCKGIAEGVENSNFLLTTDQGNHILTLYEKRVDPSDLPFFLGLMDHLAAKGVPSPVPVKARDGSVLQELCDRPAAIITFLLGAWPRRIEPDHCSGLGRVLAEMHLAGADFGLSRPNNLAVRDWRPLLESAGSDVDSVKPGLKAQLLSELDELESDWPDDLPTGVIHADLFPDNVFFRKGELSGVIDFYFACTDALAYDIAICLNAWCFEPNGSFNTTKARRLLTHYTRVRPLSDAEMTALPLLARGAAMRFLLTRLYDWLHTPADAFVQRKDPLEYLSKLTFHKAVSGPGEYGLG